MMTMMMKFMKEHRAGFDVVDDGDDACNDNGSTLFFSFFFFFFKISVDDTNGKSILLGFVCSLCMTCTF